MERPARPLQEALATLQTRWGSAAIRLGDGGPVAAASGARRATPDDARPDHAGPMVHGALALSARPEPGETPGAPAPLAGVISTGFPDLDAILGPAGLPAEASVVIRGGPSSGKTTLALRCIAEAQVNGDVVAYLDLARAFDPVEAVGRGVDLRWLLVVRPLDLVEGFSLAGALLSGRSVGLLVVDLPTRPQARTDELLRRLLAHARRVGARLVVLEPVSLDQVSLGRAARASLAGGSDLRLELERRAWLRLGRDVVGQRTAVAVAKNRYGPPGRSVDLDIHYLADGERSMATHRLIPVGREAARPEGDDRPEGLDGRPEGMDGRPERPGLRLVVA